MNPEQCTITRVKNGWILQDCPDRFGAIRGDTYVFHYPEDIAKFIIENFKIEKKKPE